MAWEERTAYQVLVGKSEGKIHLEELVVDGDQIKMDLHEKGWEDVDCIYLSPVRRKWMDGSCDRVMSILVSQNRGISSSLVAGI